MASSQTTNNRPAPEPEAVAAVLDLLTPVYLSEVDEAQQQLTPPSTPSPPLPDATAPSESANGSAAAGAASPRAQPPTLLHHLFEATATGFADHTAVEHGLASVSYQQLNVAANRLARHLSSKFHVGPDVIVGCLLPRSIFLYTALLAVLKAGGAYCAMDVNSPEDRVAFTTEDAQLRLLIATSGVIPGCTGGLPVVAIESLIEDSASLDATNLSSTPDGSDTEGTSGSLGAHAVALSSSASSSSSGGDGNGGSGGLCLAGHEPRDSSPAYVIYTSGTTGRPKGCVLPHSAVVSLVSAERTLFALSPTDRVLAQFSPAFDASVEEMWAAWAAGAVLVVADADLLRRGPALADALEALRITVLSAVPTLLSIMTPPVGDRGEPLLPGLRLLISGGEPLPPALADRWAVGRRLLNTYGPTEACVICSWSNVQPGVPVTIGTALVGHAHLHVVADPDGPAPRLAAEGEEGELLVGGPCLATGYLRRPELTAAKFVRDTWTPGAPATARLYRTGDVVCRSAEGLEYRGRVDGQVKIRGYRVELAELESLLLELPTVGAAAAALREDTPGLQQLAAYIVLRPSGVQVGVDVARGAALAHLRLKLPPPLVPSFVIDVPHLPTLPSGKVDRSALPPPPLAARCASLATLPSCPSLAAAADSPPTATEMAVASALADSLGLLPIPAPSPAIGSPPPVPLDADFFMDLGGASLAAARAVSSLRALLHDTGVDMRDLYAHPTARALAARIDNRKTLAVAPSSLEVPSSAPVWQASPPKSEWKDIELGGGRDGGGVEAFPPLIKGRVVSTRGFAARWLSGDASSASGHAAAVARAATKGKDAFDGGAGDGSAVAPSSPVMPFPVGRPIPAWAAAVQMAGAALLMLLTMGFALSLVFLVRYVLQCSGATHDESSSVLAVGTCVHRLNLGGLVILAVIPALTITWLLGLGLACKWLVVGRYQAGDYPLWSSYFLRYWFVHAVFRVVPTSLLLGTPFAAGYYRLLGAKIGKRVTISGFEAGLSEFDLVTIGDDVDIGFDAVLAPARCEGGLLRLAPITIGPGCVVGPRSAAMGGASMGPGARLEATALLAEGAQAPAGAVLAGAPAVPTGATATPLGAGGVGYGGWGLASAHLAAILLGAGIVELPLAPALLLLFYLERATEGTTALWVPFAAAPAFALAFHVILCAAIASYKWAVMGRVAPGDYPVASFFYVKWRLLVCLVSASARLSEPLYATVYTAPWLRLLGCEVGRRAEVSNAYGFTPDLVRLAPETFLADKVMLGVAVIERGLLSLRVTTVERRAFVGNSAVLVGGARLGPGALLGVASSLESTHGTLPSGSTWLGVPPFNMPRKPESMAPEKKTFTPSAAQLTKRGAVEFAQLILSHSLGFLAVYGFILAFARLYDSYDGAEPELHELVVLLLLILSVPVLSLLATFAALAVVLALKWGLVGAYRVEAKPLWSVGVWKAELMRSLLDVLATTLLAFFRGTPVVPAWLRLLGASVGPGCYLDSLFITEPDLVSIGSSCCIGNEACLQGHLFEDRVMKTGRIRLGDGCSVGPGALVLYGTEMGAGASLGAQSLMMKGETFEAGTKWHGTPATAVR